MGRHDLTDRPTALTLSTAAVTSGKRQQQSLTARSRMSGREFKKISPSLDNPEQSHACSTVFQVAKPALKWNGQSQVG